MAITLEEAWVRTRVRAQAETSGRKARNKGRGTSRDRGGGTGKDKGGNTGGCRMDVLWFSVRRKHTHEGKRKANDQRWTLCLYERPAEE